MLSSLNNYGKIIYDDETIEINDNNELYIKKFCYPVVLRKLVKISEIISIELFELTRLSGKYRYIGFGYKFAWFHLDKKRPFKQNGILLDIKGSLINYAITPDDPDKVCRILNSCMERCKDGGSSEMKNLLDKKED